METQIDRFLSSEIAGVGQTFRSGVVMSDVTRPGDCNAPGMSYTRIEFGKRGEDLACSELERLGYEIVARRYRVRSGELDIVARDGPTLVFVEVKARADREFGDAAEAVTPMKQRKLIGLAEEYLMRHHLQDCPCRFDVVAIHLDAVAPAIEVIQNAFDA